MPKPTEVLATRLVLRTVSAAPTDTPNISDDAMEIRARRSGSTVILYVYSPLIGSWVSVTAS